MDTAKINDWLQVIGLFGVIGSLIFVGLEMRQTKLIALSNANQSRTDTTVQMLLEAAANPYFLSAGAKASAGDYDSMSSEEQEARQLALLANLFHYENLYYQYTNGFISDERWQGTRENLKAAMKNRRRISFRSIYEQRPTGWSASFSRLLQDIIGEIEVEEER